MSTIRQVAELAGVSIATVSRFLSNPEKLSGEAANKVEQAIKTLNYQPNLLARNLSKSRSYSVLVLVPNIANPFLAKVVRGIEGVGQRRGYSVLLGDTRYSQERENEYLSRLDGRQVDGVIQLNASWPERLNNKAGDLPQAVLPLVNACECVDDAPCPTVSIDNKQAAETLVEYLISLGHRRIGCLLGPKIGTAGNYSPMTRERLQGYRAALEAHALQFDESLLVDGNFSVASGVDAAGYFSQLQDLPSAIFCMNDEMAIGLIQGLKTRGLKVPEDISVAGFDDIEMSRYCDPPLTTIAQPAEALGEEAMTLLCDRIEKKQSENLRRILPTELIVRASTKSYH